MNYAKPTRLPLTALATIVVASLLNSCTPNQSETKINLIYLNVERLEKVKDLIEKKDTFFTEAYAQLIVDADLELTKETNPVTNKTLIPPSGDKHDYMSIATYRFPNPDTPDGFPWIVKDGQTNPMARNNDTDYLRLQAMFEAMNKLSMAFYFSGDKKYADKAKSIIRTWFIDETTKVNPNIKYGQGIPGEVEGRKFGMIDWKSISTVVTTIQILAANNLWSDDEIKTLNAWFAEYYNWMKTNQMGIEVDTGLQNHSTCYDYQLVGIARYLGLNEEAKSRLEAAKLKRIAIQIDPNGMQPKEIHRTKSVNYSSMNLRVMTLVAELGMPLDVNLWSYTSADGRSMRKAFEFLRPFAEGKQEWAFTQITEGGAEKAIEEEMKPLFSIASTILGEQLIDESAKTYLNLNYIQRLQYPPLFKLK